MTLIIAGRGPLEGRQLACCFPWPAPDRSPCVSVEESWREEQLGSLEKPKGGSKTDVNVHDGLVQRESQQFLAGFC